MAVGDAGAGDDAGGAGSECDAGAGLDGGGKEEVEGTGGDL